MLNALVAKHPHIAGVHPMTFSDAVARRVLCGTRFDTVLALGGSASYLGADDLTAIRQLARGPMLLMHFASNRGQEPPDLTSAAAAASLDAATELAGFQQQVGRFVVTVIA